jgi:peptide/nickel transport system permease protein
MTRHVLRRLFQGIPTIFGVTLISYLIMIAAPGGPAALMTFGNTDENNAQRQIIEERFGLNDHWVIQYLTWLTGNDWMWWKNKYNEEGNLIPRYTSHGILRGDFGESIRKRQPAMNLVLERIPATIELGLSALIVSFLIGIPIGIFAAAWRGSVFDNFTRISSVIGNAVPDFWLGLMFLLIFGVLMNNAWARGNRCNLTENSRTGCSAVPIYHRLEYLLLPTIVLAYGGIANNSRFMRTSMLDTINSDYIRTARAKGLQNRTVWFRHAARNSLIPIATRLGPAIIGTIGGAVVIETIFSWPGMGLLVIEAVNGRDHPVVMASVVVASVLVVFGYIMADIFVAAADPRVRF